MNFYFADGVSSQGQVAENLTELSEDESERSDSGPNRNSRLTAGYRDEDCYNKSITRKYHLLVLW